MYYRFHGSRLLPLLACLMFSCAMLTGDCARSHRRQVSLATPRSN